jgi:hypothetical protein
MSVAIKDRVAELIAQHGSLRAAGRAIMVDHAYLSRLASGEKISPTKNALKRMGLCRTTIVVYERLPAKPQPDQPAQEVDK